MKKYIFIAIIFTLSFAACEREPDYDQLSSELVVATSLDKSAVFTSYKTFYVADTVINLGGSGADTILVGTNAMQLVNAVKSNLTARGYTFVARNAHPDLGIKIGVVKVVNVDVYPGWWTGYAGWFPYYWGGWYPYYYPYSTVYTYDTGSIIIDTYDLKNSVVNKQYKAIWNLVGFGAIGSDVNANVARGVNAINQGFEQSPYVHAN